MWMNLYLIFFDFWICIWCEWLCIWWEHLEFCFLIPPPLDRSRPKHRSRLNIHQEDKTIRKRQVKIYLVFSPYVIEYIVNRPNLTYIAIFPKDWREFSSKENCVSDEFYWMANWKENKVDGKRLFQKQGVLWKSLASDSYQEKRGNWILFNLDLVVTRFVGQYGPYWAPEATWLGIQIYFFWSPQDPNVTIYQIYYLKGNVSEAPLSIWAICV